MRVVAAALAIAVLGSLVLKPAFVSDPNELRVERDGSLYASAEDEIASVQAGTLGDRKHLWVGGTAMTLLTIDAKLMPLLPLMARPASTSALIICFGMGSAYRTALIAGLTVQGVELVPSVPGMFDFYYPDADVRPRRSRWPSRHHRRPELGGAHRPHGTTSWWSTRRRRSRAPARPCSIRRSSTGRAPAA